MHDYNKGEQHYSGYIACMPIYQESKKKNWVQLGIDTPNHFMSYWKTILMHIFISKGQLPQRS